MYEVKLSNQDSYILPEKILTIEAKMLKALMKSQHKRIKAITKLSFPSEKISYIGFNYIVVRFLMECRQYEHELIGVINMSTMKLMVLAGVVAATSLTACESMSPHQKQMGANAAGGATGAVIGARVGGNLGEGVGAGVGAGVGGKLAGQSDRNAVGAGVGASVGAVIGRQVFGSDQGAAAGAAIGGGAGAEVSKRIEEK